jgi:acetyl-CoA carboxylase biotin carboxylase subunit
MDKILIANRGEIAVRIIRTCKKLGIKSVAVFSDADRHALHTREADEAWYLGSNVFSESYLNAEKLVEIALKSGSQGVHPGYGFLSENEDFAMQVEKAGLIFIGPTPEAIKIMGNKLAAKEAVKKFNIPMVPGTVGLINDRTVARKCGSTSRIPCSNKSSCRWGWKGYASC